MPTTKPKLLARTAPRPHWNWQHWKLATLPQWQHSPNAPKHAPPLLQGRGGLATSPAPRPPFNSSTLQLFNSSTAPAGRPRRAQKPAALRPPVQVPPAFTSAASAASQASKPPARADSSSPAQGLAATAESVASASHHRSVHHPPSPPNSTVFRTPIPVL